MASLSLSVTKTNATADLTTAGPLDWALWAYLGGSTTTPDEVKSGGGGLISVTADGSPSVFSSSPRTMTWSDGTPDASGSSVNLQALAFGPTFHFSFPADTTTRIARVYIGYFNSDASITATLSDASAGPATDSTTLSFEAGDQAGYAQIAYAAGSAGQTLDVTLGYTGVAGTIQAAALELSGGGGGTTSFIFARRMARMSSHFR